MKYKIEKGTVQETLLIPLYGRKLAMDLYPDLFADKECQRSAKGPGWILTVN